jgi:hypothetical protein
MVKVLFQVKSFALFTKQTSNNRKDSALTTSLALLSHRIAAVMARAGRRGAARGLRACRILIRYVGNVFQVRNKITIALPGIFSNQTINKIPIA